MVNFRYRDIVVNVYGHNKERIKSAGFEIKYAANRDPNQKVAVTIEFTNPKNLKYAGNLVISYPGRAIMGAFDFILEGKE